MFLVIYWNIAALIVSCNDSRNGNPMVHIKLIKVVLYYYKNIIMDIDEVCLSKYIVKTYLLFPILL